MTDRNHVTIHVGDLVRTHLWLVALVVGLRPRRDQLVLDICGRRHLSDAGCWTVFARGAW